MNKILKLLTAAMVLSLMTACARRDSEDPDLGPTDNISMYPVIDGRTRSVINSIEDLQDLSEHVGVYGYKQVQNSSWQNVQTQIFDNKELFYEGIWKYSGTKYWDRKASYWFVAYTPRLSTTEEDTYVSESHSEGEHTLSIHDIPNWQVASGDAMDIMIALSDNTANSYIDEHSGVVDLYFQHILAQLVVRAFTLEENTTFKVTGLEIGADLSGKKVPSTGTSQYSVNYTTGESTFNVSANSSEVDILTGTGNNVANIDDIDDKATESYVISHMLVAPFVSDADGTDKIPVTVSYTQDDIAQTPVTVSTGISKMEKGNTYLIYLEFKDNGNKITAFNIQTPTWDEVSVSESKFHNW